MTASIIEGHALADTIIEAARIKASALEASSGRKPHLAILIMDGNHGGLAYCKRQMEFANRAYINAQVYRISAAAPQSAVLKLIAALNDDPRIDGIIPLFPFEPGIDSMAVAEALRPDKDVDGLNPINVGRLAIGSDAFAPCAPQAAIALAESVAGPLSGLNATVVGASHGVGRPLAQLLLKREATVTIAHAATGDLAMACRNADVLFAAAGKPGLIKAKHVKQGAIVIDIGINVIDAPNDGFDVNRIIGDVDVVSVKPIAKVISAVPAGVGPLTTAYLMMNAVRAAGGLS